MFPRRFTSPCHRCQLVFGNDGLGATVRDALARFEAERTRAATDLWQRLRPVLVPVRG